MKNYLLNELGFSSDSRVLLPNHDDLAMNYGANMSFIELARTGSVKSGSVMVPCPWFPHLAEIARKDRTLNIGVHLTLTSEWSNYRWRPLSACDKTSGLIDNDGYFWRNRGLLRKNLNTGAAELELRTQINTALAAGIDVTHLDCHMGIGLLPELIHIYIKLGEDYQLPILLPRNIEDSLSVFRMENIDLSFYTRIILKLEQKNYPLVDYFKITPGFSSVNARLGYEDLISEIPKGITLLSLHPNIPGTIEFIDPDKFFWRTDEHKLFSNEFNSEWAGRHNIKTISFRQIRDVLR